MLCRSESDGVMMEDVDALQLELEAMLAATVVKKRTVAHEVKIIEENRFTNVIDFSVNFSPKLCLFEPINPMVFGGSGYTGYILTRRR